MKVLAVIGSPRKNGNTRRAVERIKEKLLAADPNIGFETLFLTDLNLQTCRGCFICFAKGKEYCPLKDDRNLLEEKMLEADGVIFAAPVYAAGVPSIMKNTIDRFAYACHRPFLFDKAILCLSTAGGAVGVKPALRQLAMMAPGCKPVIKLCITSPPIEMAGLEKGTERKLIRAAKAFFRLLRNPVRRAPGLINWAYFSSFKTMTAFESYRRVCPADAEYYRDKEYFYPLKGHPVSRLMGKPVKGLMKLGMGFIIKR
jgi:NAD(P)H-dependent FMN reductase